MGLETAATIGELNALWPLGTDPKSQGDDHVRLVKSVLQADAASLANTTQQTFLGPIRIETELRFGEDTTVTQFGGIPLQLGGTNGGKITFLQAAASGEGSILNLDPAATDTQSVNFIDVIPSGEWTNAVANLRIGRSSPAGKTINLNGLNPGTTVSRWVISTDGYGRFGQVSIGSRVGGSNPDGNVIQFEQAVSALIYSGLVDAGGTANHFQFRDVNANTMATVVESGTGTSGSKTIMTREKGDARYAQTAALSAILLSIGASPAQVATLDIPGPD